MIAMPVNWIAVEVVAKIEVAQTVVCDFACIGKQRFTPLTFLLRSIWR
jgi:hypothetical protein